MKEINLQIWRNDDAEDWSIAINGIRHEHVPTQILEDLVEHAVLLAEESLLGPSLVSSASVPPAAVSPGSIQIEIRLQELTRSNDDLSTALQRLRYSYDQLLAGKPVKNVDEVWPQGDAALRKAAKAKSAG